MSETKGIYAAIPRIIAEVGPVGKTTKNTQQGYMYRSADDISDALHDALGKHGVFTTCAISDLIRSERSSKSGGSLQVVTLKATYTFHAGDGSSVSTESIGEGMDSGDKAANKAMTSAYKYALIQVFVMMGHEDSEQDSPEVAPPKQEAKPKKQAQKEKPVEKPPLYDDLLARIPGIPNLEKIQKAVEYTKAEYIAKKLTNEQYNDLSIKLCDRAVEVCETEADFLEADRIIRLMVGEMRINDAEGTTIRVNLADAKEAKLGAVA